MAAAYNLVVDQATTTVFAFQIKTGDTGWDLTNYQATMTVRPFFGSTTTTLLATKANGKITMDSTGHVVVTFSAADMNIKAESYVYDFVLNSGSIVTRILEGQFIVTAGVTV